MSTYIEAPSFSAYTDLSFAEAKEAIVNGAAVDVWWFDMDGTRRAAKVLFTEFNTIREMQVT